jgi:hypothetical protein
MSKLYTLLYHDHWARWRIILISAVTVSLVGLAADFCGAPRGCAVAVGAFVGCVAYVEQVVAYCRRGNGKAEIEKQRMPHV